MIAIQISNIKRKAELVKTTVAISFQKKQTRVQIFRDKTNSSFKGSLLTLIKLRDQKNSTVM